MGEPSMQLKGREKGTYASKFYRKNSRSSNISKKKRKKQHGGEEKGEIRKSGVFLGVAKGRLA